MSAGEAPISLLAAEWNEHALFDELDDAFGVHGAATADLRERELHLLFDDDAGHLRRVVARHGYALSFSRGLKRSNCSAIFAYSAFASVVSAGGTAICSTT